MKWLVLAFLVVCLAKFSEGGVFQYARGNQNVSKKSETKEEKKESHIQVSQEEEPRDFEDAECLPGTEWESHCHYCRCSESGIAECLKQNTCQSETVIEPIRCKPNTTFTRGCNTCVCLESGLGLCTVNYCRRSSLPKKSDLLSGRECAPGSHWKSQCNDCGCSLEGYAFCTEKGCLGQESEPVLRCAPDSMWKNQCNTCWCTSDGRALCTKMGCLSDTEYADINFEGESKKLEEQQTQLNVSVPRRVRSIPSQTPPKNCQPREEFRLDCNQCLCDSDGKEFSCTRFDCSKISNGGVRRKRGLAKEVATKCVPESVFDQECNVCRCTKDGNHATCTLKRCGQEKQEDKSENAVDSSNTDPSFRCNPGEQFKRICNDCTCSADGRSIFCTLRLCDEDMTPSE